MTTPTDSAGNPILAAKSVWQSNKFRAACYGAITTVLSAFVTGFLAALIPKLPADQIAGVMQWVATVVGGSFATAIGGAAYVDAAVQTSNGSVATQAAVSKAQAAAGQAQAAAGRAQDAATPASSDPR